MKSIFYLSKASVKKSAGEVGGGDIRLNPVDNLKRLNSSCGPFCIANVLEKV